MTDYTAYRLYRAMKLHFTQLSYDVVEKRGAVRGLTYESFQKKREAKWFLGLAKKFKTEQEFVQFLIGNAAYGDISDIFDLQAAHENYEKWIANKQRSTQLILNDLYDAQNLEQQISGTPPAIIQKVIAGRINIETAVAINRVYPFLTDEFFKEDYLIITKTAVKIKKLDRFVKYNTEKINLAISTQINTTLAT